jgi:hypothetical protein
MDRLPYKHSGFLRYRRTFGKGLPDLFWLDQDSCVLLQHVWGQVEASSCPAPTTFPSTILSMTIRNETLGYAMMENLVYEDTLDIDFELDASY